MIPLTLQEIALATNGTLHNGAPSSLSVHQVSTDSRVIPESCLFIALKGENFDAHQFIGEVELAGAVSLLVEHKVATQLPYIVVADTRIALGLLAAWVKQKINGLKCAAITGSNGKTTTKELLSHILSAGSSIDNSVLATAGNFNNDIGLPLTLLRLTEQHRFAVVELGANHAGEIAYTANLAKPDVALINNVMPAHLQGFGSLAGVAQAKGEIWSSLAAGGTAVVNLDSDFSDQYLQQLQALPVNILTFSQQQRDANLCAGDISFAQTGKALFTLQVNTDSCQQKIAIQLNLPGKHNISNALAAAAMALALGATLEQIQCGLNTVKSVSGRVNGSQINDLITVIDDTYNANSASVKAAIDLLSQYSGEHLLILGDMGELGEHSEQQHRAVGQYAAQLGIKQLLTVGQLSAQTAFAFQQQGTYKALHFSDKQQLTAHLQKTLLVNSKKLTILVKGSRGAKMEEIVAYIKQLPL